MISLEDRIYGLSVLWKDLECNFAFWNKVPHINWNDVYKEYLSKVMDTHDDLSYYGELLKMIALLKDGHTYITIPDEIKPPYSVPIGTTFIEGKHELSTLPKDCGIPLYSEIISVDGILLEEYLEEKVYPYI